MVARVCFPGITTDELLQRVTIRSKRRGVGKRKVKKDKKKKGAEEEPEGEPEEEDEVEDEVTTTPANSPIRPFCCADLCDHFLRLAFRRYCRIVKS